MAFKGALKHLAPNAGRHAIQECVFTLFLAQETPIQNAKNALDLHKGKLKKDFPKLDILTTQAANLQYPWQNFTGEPVSRLSQPYGFSFEKFKPDGTFHSRLRGETTSTESWVAANILQYSDWTEDLTRAKGWLSQVGKQFKPLQVTGFCLHTTDHFHWESPSRIPLAKIINPKTKFLPARFADDVNGWDSKSTYIFERNGLTYIEMLDVTVQRRESDGHQRLSISMPFRVDLPTTVSFGNFLKNKADDGFDSVANFMHQQNLEHLRNILTRPVGKEIGVIK